MENKPTNDIIKRTLQASQKVWLAKGYSDACKTVYVFNYNYPYPEFGNWKSFAEIRNELREAIDKEFPKKAFPYREIEDTITLWQNIREFYTFKVIEESKEGTMAVGVARLKAEHPEWYSATGSLGLRDFQIDAFGVKDAEMERHFVQNMNSGTINKLDDLNRRDMRNWSDEEE